MRTSGIKVGDIVQANREPELWLVEAREANGTLRCHLISRPLVVRRFTGRSITGHWTRRYSTPRPAVAA
jgi:hypothetical protein